MATENCDEDYVSNSTSQNQILVKLDVGEQVLGVDAPKDARTSTGRWCHRQYAAEAWNEDAISGTPSRMHTFRFSQQ